MMRMHYLLWGISAVFFTGVGAVLAGQADYIKSHAIEQGRTEAIMQLPIKYLTELPVSGEGI